MSFYEELRNLMIKKVSFEVLWEWLQKTDYAFFLQEMQKVCQNPEFHGEGNVCIHTKFVCKALMELEPFQKLELTEKLELLLAALLHDVGKIKTTVFENGQWASPRHSFAGCYIARNFLWKTCGLCGTEENMQIRESVCYLVRYHMLPAHIIERKNAEFQIRQIASLGELAKGFSWHNLCILAEADILGRRALDIQECKEKVELCRLLAEEAECLEKPFLFRDSFTKHAYLTGRNVLPNQTLYDDTWGEVLLIAGLPGTGKDTWISRHMAHYPVISLDGIRRELKIKPTDAQGTVIQQARERAKQFLRKKEPFIWNATNLTRDIRQRQVSLFEQYGARVKIVYLETDECTRTQRNSSREDFVPEDVAQKMLSKTEPPDAIEAQSVEWHCI